MEEKATLKKQFSEYIREIDQIIEFLEKKGFQMMRKGYYVIDLDGNSFNRTVSLKEGWIG